MKRTYKQLLALLVGVACMIGVSTSWAVYTHQIVITNPFETATSSAVLVENFNPASTFLPGETVDKNPYFKNTGDLDLVLRVKVKEAWIKGDKALPDNTDVSVVEKKWSSSWTNDWVKIGDYFYYKHVLKKSGESGDRTSIVLESLKLSTKISNDEHFVDYSGLIYTLNFEAEAVPADALSVSTWELSPSEDTELLEWKNLLSS